MNEIQYSDIKKYRRNIIFEFKGSNKFYCYRNTIYKIKYKIEKNFESILEYIDKANLDELIELIDYIYDYNKLVGYSFKLYKDYSDLNKLSFRTFDLKIKDGFNIISSFDTLSQHNIKYGDFHKGNVLLNYKTNNIKICDIDSIKIQDRNLFEKKQALNAFMLALAHIYNLRFNEIYMIVRDRYPINNKVIIADDDFNIDYTFKFLEDLDVKSIPDERKLIKRRAKQLFDTGYFRTNQF